ncbi:MAG: HNH endonuclease [Chthoniobacterales bacterium]|nr:HNH endonuclease [Chthoniobacterales bacterium]
MPTPAEKNALFQRDGYHCRFCGIPVIRREVRDRIRKVYPDALRWAAKNAEQHATFQLMWATCDHVLPHSRGGTSDLDNTIIVCQPCNCARWHYTLDEVGLADPRLREPTRSSWDGLERFR